MSPPTSFPQWPIWKPPLPKGFIFLAHFCLLAFMALAFLSIPDEEITDLSWSYFCDANYALLSGKTDDAINFYNSAYLVASPLPFDEKRIFRLTEKACEELLTGAKERPLAMLHLAANEMTNSKRFPMAVYWFRFINLLNAMEPVPLREPMGMLEIFGIKPLFFCLKSDFKPQNRIFSPRIKSKPMAIPPTSLLTLYAHPKGAVFINVSNFVDHKPGKFKVIKLGQAYLVSWSGPIKNNATLHLMALVQGEKARDQVLSWRHESRKIPFPHNYLTLFNNQEK